MLMSLIMVISMFAVTDFSILADNTNMKASTGNEIDLELNFWEVQGGNTWMFTKKLASASSGGFYRVNVTIDGNNKKDVLIDYAGNDFYIYGHCFDAVPGSGSTVPTTSFVIEKDTVLLPVTTDNWATEDTSRKPLKLTKKIEVVFENGIWKAKEEQDTTPEVTTKPEETTPETTTQPVVVVPKSISLKLNGLNSDRCWFFANTTDETVNEAFYKVATEIDGQPYNIVMEYSNGQFMIYQNFFTATPGIDSKEPTSTFKIAKDAMLVPVSSTGWGEIAGGQTYKLAKEIYFEYSDGSWAEPSKIEKSVVELGDCNWSDNNTLGLAIKNNTKLKESEWYKNIKVEDAYTWVSLTGKVIADGREIDMAFDFPGNGEVFVRVNGNAKKNIMVKKDSVFSSIDGNIRVNMDKNYEIDVLEKAVYEEGKRPVEKTPINLSMSFNGISEKNWFFQNTSKNTIEKGFYKVKVLVDGKEQKIVMEYDRNQNQFMIYHNFFTETPGSNSVVPTKTFKIPKGATFTAVDPNKSWNKIVGAQGYVAEKEMNLKCDNGVWGDPADIQNSTIRIGTYSWSDDNTFGFRIENVKELKKSKWYSSIATDKYNTWVSTSGKLYADGKEISMSVDFPGNGEVFLRVNDYASKTLVIKKNSVFSTLDGKIRIRFEKNYEIDLVEKLVFEEGKRPKEKKSVDIKLEFNKVANNIFDFLGNKTNGKKLKDGFYRTEAYVDGKKMQVIVEYVEYSGLFYLYPHCFTSEPGRTVSNYPKKTFKIKAGAKLVPVVKDVWSKDFSGQPYKIKNTVDIIINNNVWMTAKDKKIYDSYKPLDVYVSYEMVEGRALMLNVKTVDGKSLKDTYGDWTMAYGAVERGIEGKPGKYTFTQDPQTSYNMTESLFYMGTLRLSELDAVKVEKGTIIYPDKTCKTRRPLKVCNTFCMVRDEKDKWKAVKAGSIVTEVNENVDNSLTSPSTKDNSGLRLAWISLIVSGGMLVALNTKRRKRVRQ